MTAAVLLGLGAVLLTVGLVLVRRGDKLRRAEPSRAAADPAATVQPRTYEDRVRALLDAPEWMGGERRW
jgi:hypothetical protein